MTEKKITPAEVAERLMPVFPWLVEIKRTGFVGRTIILGISSPIIEIQTCEIDWGSETSYKPEKWRPATVGDFVRHANGKEVIARVDGRVGKLFGASKPITGLAFGVVFSDESVWRAASLVEVRE